MAKRDTSDPFQEIYEWNYISTLVTEYIKKYGTSINKYGLSRIGARKRGDELQLFITIPIKLVEV